MQRGVVSLHLSVVDQTTTTLLPMKIPLVKQPVLYHLKTLAREVKDEGVAVVVDEEVRAEEAEVQVLWEYLVGVVEDVAAPEP